MISHTPLDRYILVVVGEEPRSRAALVSPVFDKETRDNDIIGAVTTLAGITDQSPAKLFESISEIADAIARIDYSLASPVGSNYVGDIPVSFQVLPENYGKTEEDSGEAEPDPDATRENENIVDFNSVMESGDIAFVLKFGDRAIGFSGASEDVEALLSDPSEVIPLVLHFAEHLNPGAASVIGDLLAPTGIDFSDLGGEGPGICLGGFVDQERDADGEPEDDDENAIYAISLPVDLAPEIIATILDFSPEVTISRVG